MSENKSSVCMYKKLFWELFKPLIKNNIFMTRLLIIFLKADGWKDVVAGIVGGIALVCAGHPLDTVIII